MPEQAAVALGISERIREMPALYGVAMDYYTAAMNDEVLVDDIYYEPLLLQSHRRCDPAVAGYIVSVIHGHLCKGWAAAVRIEVGSKPPKDKFADEIRAALANLPEPFVATFVGGTHDQDGTLKWDSASPLAPKHPAWDCDGIGILPLEVGKSDPETLYFHYKQCAGFARWSYDSTEIIAIRRLHPLPKLSD